MDKKVRDEKLKMWKKQEEEMQKQLNEAMKAKGQAASEGDLSENAAYQMAVEEADVISARLVSIQKMIRDLEGGK